MACMSRNICLPRSAEGNAQQRYSEYLGRVASGEITSEDIGKFLENHKSWAPLLNSTPQIGHSETVLFVKW